MDTKLMCRVPGCSAARFRAFAQLIRDNSGVAAIEYALLCALLALAIVSGISEIGSKVSDGFTNVHEEVAKAMKNNGKGKGHGRDKEKPKKGD